MAQFANDVALALRDYSVGCGAVLEAVQALGLFLADVMMALLIGMAAALIGVGAGADGAEGHESGSKGKKLHRVFISKVP